MPLVRIDCVRGRSADDLRALADTVQEVMREVFAAPPGDRYQVIHQHEPGEIVCDDTGLGIDRSDDVVVVAVTQQGRAREQKEALYATLAQRLDERDQVRGVHGAPAGLGALYELKRHGNAGGGGAGAKGNGAHIR